MNRKTGIARKPGKAKRFLILIVLAVLFSIIMKAAFPNPDAAVIIAASGEACAISDAPAETDETLAAVDLIPVYLVGAVQNPGIYQVEKGSYLFELVELAGGLTPDAAAEEINLAARLDSNQRIRLPTRSEMDSDPSLDPDLVTDSSFMLVDINRANQSQLESLPGIGPSTAMAILNYREQCGGFKQIEDLMKIAGIKQSRFNAIKDLICITGY